MSARTKRFFVMLGGALLVGAALAVLAMAAIRSPWLLSSAPDTDRGPPELKNVLLPSPNPIKVFSLRDDNGRRFDLDRLRGRWTLMFFGYTSCPDICPTTLATLRDLAELLEERDEVQYVFVTVDPSRDDPERIGDYLDYFDPDFVGVSGEPADIEAFMKQLNVAAVRREAEDSDSYTFSHTSAVMLIDPEARLLGAFSPPHKASRMAEHFQTLVSYIEEKQ